MESRLKYLGKNTIIFAVSTFVTKVLSFVLLPLYTNILTTSEYGTADIISTAANLLFYVLTLNIADAVVRFCIDSEEPDKIVSYGIRVLIIGSGVCTIGLVFTYFLRIVDWPLFYYFILFATFFSNSFYAIITGYLRGTNRITQVGISGIISAATIIILNIVFLKGFHFGINGYLLSMFLGPFVASLYGVISSRLPLQNCICCYCDKPIRKNMIKFSTPLIFNSIALWINNYLDKFFIISLCGVDQNGIYAIANKIPTILASIFSVFTSAWGLSAIRDIDSDDSSAFFSKVYNYYISGVFLVCSILVLCNVSLAKMLFKGEFFEAWQYSTVLLLVVAINALTAFLGALFSAAKKTVNIATTTLLAAIVNIILNAILIPFWGVMGAAIATCVSYLVMLISRMVLLNRIIPFKIHIARDLISFFIVLLQVFFDHTENHFYLGQGLCLFLICLLLHKTILDFCAIGKNYIVSFIHHNKTVDK